MISLSERLGLEVSKAACAYALAVLASERIAGRAIPPGGAIMSSSIVIKVGGSLFDLPDLASRLTEFLNALDRRQWLLVPGGARLWMLFGTWTPHTVWGKRRRIGWRYGLSR